MSTLSDYVRTINNCSEYLNQLISLNPSVLSSTYGTIATPYGSMLIRMELGEEPVLTIGYPTHNITEDGDNRIDFAAYFLLDQGIVDVKFDVVAYNQYRPSAEEIRYESETLSRSLGLLFGDYAKYLHASYTQGTAKEFTYKNVGSFNTLLADYLAVPNLPYSGFARRGEVAVTVSSVPAPDGIETVLLTINKDYVQVSIEQYGAMQVTAGRISDKGSTQSWERPQTGEFGNFTLPKDYLKGRITDSSIIIAEELFTRFMLQYK